MGNDKDVTILNYDILNLSEGNLFREPPGYTTMLSLNKDFEANSMNLEPSIPLKKKKIPYQCMKPYFEELCSVMEGVAEQDNIVYIHKFLNDQILVFKQRTSNKIYGCKHPPGTLVSVGHPSCKKTYLSYNLLIIMFT